MCGPVWSIVAVGIGRGGMRSFIAYTLLTLVAVLPRRTDATDVFFFDIEAISPSGRYQVTAKSPANEDRDRRIPFQSSFVYTFTDRQRDEVLWTRKQAMGEPYTWGDDSEHTHTQMLEGSPASIYVSDSGFTVIYTGWNELILVDRNGRKTGKVNILEDCLTDAENAEYVHATTAGPVWAGRSHWYFATADAKEYFIIRPWWGRHLIVELLTGSVKMPTSSLVDAAQKAETEYVLRVLDSVLDGTATECDCCGHFHELDLAAYLAGVLGIKEAVPGLRKVEDSNYIGMSAIGGSLEEMPEGRISPFRYSAYTTRQNVHLALRRLGEKPGPFPCTIFRTEHNQYRRRQPYERNPVPGSRESNAEKVKKEMSPEQVIDLIDTPDYVLHGQWQYDIDAQKAYTLKISWTDEKTVKDVSMVRPPLWQEGTVRDQQ